MARLGTWTTLDCPVDEKQTAEAYLWLKEKVQAIGGDVRKVINAHDFGGYPSFEIDRPYGLENLTDDDADDLETANDYTAWLNGINMIELNYSTLFSE